VPGQTTEEVGKTIEWLERSYSKKEEDLMNTRIDEEFDATAESLSEVAFPEEPTSNPGKPVPRCRSPAGWSLA
jgi:hypothetical protein